MNIKAFIKKHRIKLSVISVSLLVLIVAAAILISSIFSSGASPAVADIAGINYHKIDVIPLSFDKTGVDIQSGFKITSKQDISEAALKSVLKVTPSQEYKLKKLSSTEYRLNFKDGLKPNSIYKISMGNKAESKRSWAFQTKKVFRIERTLPRNISTDVPLNSGIEITFSDENMENINKYFEISPKTEGKFEHHKKTVVFVPEKLAANTVYTVTVKKGIGLAGSDDKIKEDYTFKFQTVMNQSDNSNEKKYFNIEVASINNFTADTLPELQLYGDEYFKNKKFNVEIYKYPSDKEFMSDLKKYDTLPYWAHTATDAKRFETNNLTVISSFKTTLFNMNNQYWNTYILRFPSKLSEGHYLVNVSCENKVKQALLQVSNNVCYFMAGEKNSLAWINDSVTGKPVKGVSIEAEGLGTAETGKDGVAVLKGKIPDPEKGANYYFKASRENKPAFIAPLAYYQYTEADNKPECKYWSYMYLDRGLYLPTDTVNLWGIAKPRNGSDASSKATLELYPSAYNGSSDNDRLSMISSKEVTLSSLGTYNSRMDISNLSQGSYYIQLKLGDSIVSCSYFEVRQYTKPAYKLTAVADKNPLFSWESTNLAVQASFFEGSPVTGLNLNYYYKATSNNEGKLKCDQNGSAQLTLHPDRSADTFRPYYMDYNISNAQAEEETISTSGEVVVFPSDFMIETKTTKNGTKGLVDVQTHYVSFNKKTLEEDIWDSPDAYRGSSADKQLHASIYEEYWTAKENGKYYDFIDKTVHKLYQYTKAEKLVKTLDFKTKDGKYSFDFNIDADKTKNYKISIKGTGAHNNTIVEDTYLDGYTGYDPNSYTAGFKYYSVESTSDKSKFKTGDTVSLDLNCNGQAVPESSNARTLYLRLSNGLLGYTITDNTKYSFAFDSSYIPNMYVQGVYFDGKNIFNAGCREVLYDYEKEKLNIKVQPDKKEYKPGEKVKLDISVTDSSGKPCKSEVNLSVVDEALFAIQDQSVDTLEALYRSSFYTGIISDYVSFRQLDLNGNNTAEMGEGGDESVRYMFKDNGYFGTIRTGSDGKGETSFTLPDNLTSWRITYQGVTDDLLAGSGTVNVTSKLPFFIDVIFNNVFMTGDSPSITTRSFGTAVDKNDSVAYTVTVTGANGYKKTFTKKGLGNGYANTALGKLSEGNYSVTVSAVKGKYKDAIKKDFKVVNNILEASRSRQYPLKEGLKPEGGSSLTTLTFYNKASSLYHSTLWELMGQWGDRVDQKLSRKLSLELMKKYYPDYSSWYDSSEEFNMQAYQCGDGGMALLSYDTSDPVLSAKICSLAKDSIDESTAKQYFYGIINNTEASPENVAAAYWGLASLNEPVLLEVKDLLESKEIGLKERIYLGIALAEIGDTSGAEGVYSKIAPGLKHAAPYIYLNSGKDRDDIIDSTALLSVLALKIDASEKDGLFAYVTKNSTKDILVNLEKMIFVTASAPDFTKSGKFTIKLDGVKKVVKLDKSETFQVTLTPEKLKNIGFSDISGSIEVSSSFTGPITDLLKSNNIIRLNRTYSSDNRQTGSFNQSDLIKIVLHPSFSKAAPDGYYEITDALPSCLRYVPSRPVYGNNWYFEDINSQKVSFWYNYQKNSKEPLKDVVYYARAVSPGEFTADYAVIKDLESDASGFAPRKQLEIIK